MGGFTRRRCGTNVDFQAAHDVAAGSLAAMVMGFQGGCEDGGQALQSATATFGRCKDGGKQPLQSARLPSQLPVSSVVLQCLDPMWP